MHGENVKLDTTLAHITWHIPTMKPLSVLCRPSSPPALAYPSLFPLHLILFQGVLPPGLVVEHSVMIMRMGGLCFCWFFWWESRGANPYPSAFTSLLERLQQTSTLPQNPLQSHSAFCISHIGHPPVTPVHPPLTLCGRQDPTHCALNV